MNDLIVNSLSYTLVTYNGKRCVKVVDISNKHQAILGLGQTKKFYVISSTFPAYGKRYYEMLYIAEVNKERIYA